MNKEITMEKNGFYCFRRGFPNYTKSIFLDKNEIVVDDYGRIIGVTNPGKFLFASIPPTDGTLQLLEVGKKAFSLCTRLRSISFSDNLEIIGEEAFLGCSALSSISLPPSVYEIGEGAFEKTNIKSFIFPTEIEHIPPRIFMENKGLECVGLSDKTKTLGVLSFAGCTALKSISLPKRLGIIPDGVFMSSGITSITLPNTIERIGSAAFSQCRYLTAIFYDGDESDFRLISFGRNWNRGINKDCALYLKDGRGSWYNAFEEKKRDSEIENALLLFGFHDLPSKKELREAYHKKAVNFHPDRLSSLNLDEAFTRFAEEKFKEYKNGYDTIIEYIEKKGER